MGKNSPSHEEQERASLIDFKEEAFQQSGPVCAWSPPEEGQAGSRCPMCGEGVLDYDGMLNLHCPRCHYVEGGCFT